MLLGIYKLLEANKKEINLRNGTANIWLSSTDTLGTQRAVSCIRQGGREWDMNMYEKHIREDGNIRLYFQKEMLEG